MSELEPDYSPCRPGCIRIGPHRMPEMCLVREAGMFASTYPPGVPVRPPDHGHIPYTGKPYRPDYYRPQRKNPRIDPSADVSDVVHAWDVKDHRVASAIERLLRAGKKPGESFLKDLHKSMEEIHRAIEFAEMEQGGEG